MSGVVVIAPLVITTAWPAISAAAVSVMAALGYAAVSTRVDVETMSEERVENSVEIELENSQEVGDCLGREEELVFRKEDIVVNFRKDIRGRLRVCVTGDSMSKVQLREMGEELANRVVQQYVYNRVISELGSTEFSIVEQEVDEDETIKIKLRAWD